MPAQEKHFAVSLVVSCKDMACKRATDECDRCLEAVVTRELRKYQRFRASRITTANGSRQFGVSLEATCRLPDCAVGLPRAVACCTASADKCEMCLATIISREVRQMRGFHVKEILVV